MDKVCAVFGGSRGIGRAVAQLMARKGYRLAIIARNLDVAKAAAGELGGSIIGLKGNSGQSVYSASKGGLVGFSRALAKEVARKKIRVNVVAPGYNSLQKKNEILLAQEAEYVESRSTFLT
uniref:3-ketoacyl-[acyl-carrier-protein] reductase beta subunit n=1 Tax=Equus caballus TaxID=9796 RepID=A0A9L0RGZ2_HORSE